MRTIEIQAYKFNELDEQTKLQVIEDNIHINVEFDWWDCTYDTLRECGIKVNSFDIGRRQECEIEFLEEGYSVAKNIVDTFGEAMEITKDAKNFIERWDALVKHHGEGNDIDGYSVKEELYDDFDEDVEGITIDLKKNLEYEILRWLRGEYEHLTSEESIIETIEANEYEFTEEGKSIKN
jgi:hypothetical protein